MTTLYPRHTTGLRLATTDIPSPWQPLKRRTTAPNPSDRSWHFWQIRTTMVTLCSLYLSSFNYIHLCDCITFSIKGPSLALSHQSGWGRTRSENGERPMNLFSGNLPWCEVDENKQCYSLEGLVLLWVEGVTRVESKCWARYKKEGLSGRYISPPVKEPNRVEAQLQRR